MYDWRWVPLAVVLGVACGGVATAAETAVPLSVRLVAADNSAQAKPDPGLEDILPLLQGNLPFTSYRLKLRRQTTLTEGGQVPLETGLQLVFSGVRGTSFVATVRKQDETLVETRLTLRRDSPVVLGGIPADGGGKLIVVIQSP